MNWPSKWSSGFPGWHLECSAMSVKYLGESFDIHGGGMDLQFPHHECEIAQSTAALKKESVRYWIHNNMITINGQKMARSLGNFITLDQMFSGHHPDLVQAYSPMTIRFFILQAHYRSVVDFSNEALQAAEKGLQKLHKAIDTLKKIKPSSASSSVDIDGLKKKCHDSLNDDLNSAETLSHLFEGVRIINLLVDGSETITAADLEKLAELFHVFVFDILGLKKEAPKGDEKLTSDLMKIIIDARQEAKSKKDWATSDKIRDDLKNAGVILKDTKEGASWEIE